MPEEGHDTQYREMEIKRGIYTIPIVDGHYDLSEFFVSDLNKINSQVIRRLNALPENPPTAGDIISSIENTRVDMLNRYEAKLLLSLVHQELDKRRPTAETATQPQTKENKQIDEELDDMESFFKGRTVVGGGREKINAIKTKFKARLAEIGLSPKMQAALAENAILIDKLSEHALENPRALAEMIAGSINEMMPKLEMKGLRFNIDGTLMLKNNQDIADPNLLLMVQEVQALIEVAIKLGVDISWAPIDKNATEKEHTTTIAEKLGDHLKRLDVPMDIIALVMNNQFLNQLERLNYQGNEQAILLRAIDQNLVHATATLKKMGVKKISNNGEIELGFFTFGKEKKIVAIKQSVEYQEYEALQTIAHDIRSAGKIAPILPLRPKQIDLGVLAVGLRAYLKEQEKNK